MIIQNKLANLKVINERVRNCKNCELWKTRTQPIIGEGNLESRLMLIAQAPGYREDEEGRMFVGPSGKVLDELLNLANINRKKVYMTNLIKCILPKNRRPRADEVKICSKYLDREIELIDPAVIAPLGYYAIKYVFRKYAVPMPSKPEFYKVYGKLFLADKRKILPLKHPAAVLYQNILKEEIKRNYRKMSVLLTDCRWYPVCPMKRFYEEGKLSREWIERYCKGDWESCIRYRMEEKGEPHPDWMLPDGSSDENVHKSYS